MTKKLVALVVVLGLSGVAFSQIPAARPGGGGTPTGAAGGDLSGTYPSPTVSAVHATSGTINGVAIGGTTPSTGAFTTVTATGNVNVQGNISSASNTNPAGPTNSGVALNATPNIADVQMFDSTRAVDDRTAEWIFWSGVASLRFANDAHNAVATPLTVTGGQASGITGIASNSGTGTWVHTGPFSATGQISSNGPIISTGSTPATFPNIATNSYFYGQGQNGNAGFGVTDNTRPTDSRNVGFGFTGGFFNGQYVNDAQTASTKWLQVQGSFSTGATAINLHPGTGTAGIILTPSGITSNSGSGSWAHTGSFSVSGASTAGSFSTTGAMATGAVATGIRTVTSATYTATSTDHTIICSATANPINVTLPSSPPTGMVIAFKKADSTTANACTLGGGGFQIDGGTSIVITAQYSSVVVQFDGTKWWIISSFGTVTTS